MPAKKKVKLTKEDLEKERYNKLIQEKIKREEEEQEEKKKEDEDLQKKKEIWKKNELKKSLEKLKMKKIEHKKEEMRRQKRQKKEEKEKENEEKENEEAETRSKTEAKKGLSIKTVKIKYRNVNIELNKEILKIIVCLEKIILDTNHQLKYKSILSDTVKCIINNMKDEMSVGIGPLDMLCKYIYSIPQKNQRDKVDYIETVANFLLDQDIEFADVLLSKLDAF